MISLSLYKVSENKKLKISNLENARSENGSLPVIVSVTIKAEENGNGICGNTGNGSGNSGEI